MRDLLTEAKARLPLSRLMAELGNGDRARKSARCPFHEDSSASFSLYVGDDGQERWRCFAGCGGGDAVDWLARHRGLSNAEACREFIRLAGVTDTPPRPSFNSSQTPPATSPPFNWQACVAAFTADHAQKLAQWRGYSPQFVAWLHAQSLVGLFDVERIALPVHDAAGGVVACHFRKREDASWRFHPTGTRTAPLIFGDLAGAARVFCFESQWDAFAVADKLSWHVQAPDATAAAATRGASNARLLAGRCRPDATVFAFAQNDVAGQKWLADIAAACGCKCLHAVTPGAFKDANEWTQAGASRADIEAAITNAVPVTAAPDLHAAAPRRVSRAVILLPESEDDDEPAPAEFPLDALPPALAGMVAAVARCERVPVALPALAALGVASASVGAGLEVGSGANRVTRGNLFLLGSAESGSGKSETFRIVAAPLLDHQSRLLETWRNETAGQLAEQITTLEAQIKRLTREASRKGADPADVERINGEKAFKRAQITDLTSRATMPCIIAQDVTTERLATILRDNREVTFSASADARKVIQNLLGRYNALQSTDESLYLSGYSGDFVRVDRQGRDAVVLHRPCLALCWLVQPDLLGTMLGEETLSASGFLPRLLVCDTRATPRRIEGEAPTLPEQMRLAWWQLIADLLATYHGADAPQQITPAPAALAVLTEFHNAIVDRREADLADVGAFAARYAENAWRVAVVLHAGLYGAAAHAHPLDAETAANAVRVVEWFAAAQLEILSKARRQVAAKLEDQVLELITSNRDRKVQNFTTARDVQRARIASSAEAARALLSRMEATGLLIGEDIAPPGGGRAVRIFRAASNSPLPG